MLKLRPFQQEALHSFESHPHTLLIAPTGAGKSLIFQTYLKRNPKVRALLISPLNALSRQHEAKFRELGIPAAIGGARNGGGPPDGPGVWILNPESMQGRGAARVRGWGPRVMIVDEAHCVWEWGRSFRPGFREIPAWIATFGIARSFWCTATLPREALTELQSSIPGPLRILGSFLCPEALEIQKIRVRSFERLDLLRTLLHSNENESGMIFVNTRSGAERIQKYLTAWGVRSIFYHAGISKEERIALEGTLAGLGTSIWVVATSAFGMGMDYPFLRTCILYEPSFTMLSLAQALGRVGRGGSRARAFVLWDEEDFHPRPGGAEEAPEFRKRLLEVRDWCRDEDHPKEGLSRYFN